VGGGDGVGPGFPFRGRGLALPARWPPRPPFGFGGATLVGFRSLVGLSVRRVRPYRLLRPSSSLGFDRFHRRPVAGSRGHQNDTCFVPSRTLRSSPLYRAASNFRSTARPFRVAAPSGNVHRAASRPSPRPPLFGFCPLRRFRTVAASPRLPHLGTGACRVSRPSWRLLLRIGPPRSVSSGSVPGVSPVRASPSFGIAGVSRRPQALVPFLAQVTNTRRAAAPGRISRRGRHPARTVRRHRAVALMGFLPLQGFQPAGLSAFAAALTDFSTGGMTRRRRLPGQSNRPAFPGLDEGGRSQPS